MSLTVTAAIHQAQESLDRGDYPRAATLCDRLVTQFPGYARAWMLLGEAFREQGQNADAQRAYQAAATRHLRAPLAYQGLGLLAEEQGNADGALAFCQVGWELAPSDQSMREPLMRMALRRYATDGELQYTLPALAQQHLRSSRLRRAVQTWRTAAAQFPERADVQAGLALALWRTGNDAEAATLCDALLDRFPESAEPLGMLTDIHARAGDMPRAQAYLERLRAVDPDGEIAARLSALHPGANASLLCVAEERLPLVDESIHGTVAERPRLAPAPDMDYVPVRADAELAQLESLRLGDLGGPADALPEPTFDPFAGALGVDPPAARPQAEAAPTAESAAPTPPTSDVAVDTVVSEGLLPDNLQPMSLEEFGAQPGEELPTFAPEHLLGAEDMEVGLGDAGFAAATAAWDPWSDPVSAEAPVPPPPTTPVFNNPVASDLDALAADDFDAFDWEAPALEPIIEVDLAAEDAVVAETAATAASTDMPPATTPVDPFSDLAQELRGDVSEALERAGQTDDAQDGQIDSHRPPVDDPRGFTTMLRSLDDAGIAPFDPRSREPIADMPSMMMHDDEISNATPTGAPVTDRLGEIAHDWESIDAEIQAAMPASYSPGYTDELRALDQIGLMPFEVELGDGDADDDDDDEGGGAHTLDDILMGELVSITSVQRVPAVEPPSAASNFGDLDELLGDLQPFAAEEFDQDVPPPVSPTQSFSFSQGAWDAALSGSTAVPSDADLEALLNEPDDPPMPPPPVSLTNDLMLRRSSPPAPPAAPLTALPDLAAAEELDSAWQASGLAEDVAAVFATDSDAGDERNEIIEMDHSGTEQLAAELDALEALQALDASIAEDDRAFAAAQEAAAQEAAAAGETTDAATANDVDAPATLSDADLAALDGATADAAMHADAADLEDDIVTAELGTPPHLQPDPQMLERARDAKQSLIDTGLITGQREFDDFAIDAPTVMLGGLHQPAVNDAADEPMTDDQVVEQIADEQAADEPLAAEPVAEDVKTDTFSDEDTASLTLPQETEWSASAGTLFGTSQLPEPEYDEEDEDDIIHGIGATRDTATLRAALGITPEDAELHWWLGEALRERGEMPAAVDEYRWLIRHAPERSDAVLQALLETVERGQELELVHRMLGDVYRRRGNTQRASHHASQALQARRRANQATHTHTHTHTP